FWEFRSRQHQMSKAGGDAREDAEALLFAHLMLPETQLQENGLMGNGYPMTLWRPDDIVDDRRDFELPEMLTPGKAYFEVGLFWLAPDGGLQRAGILDGDGNIAGDQVVFGPIAICDAISVASFDELTPLDARFEERIELAGIKLEPRQPGDVELRAELGWRALDRTPTAYTAFVHLLDAQGNLVGQHDFPVGGPENPTNLWVPGEQIRSSISLPIPSDSDLADYRLRIGLYEPVGGRQLAVTEPKDGASTFILLDMAELLP
ncbi:MAG: hypothetical protein R6W76_08355, partial [Caldilinea sp.]